MKKKPLFTCFLALSLLALTEYGLYTNTMVNNIAKYSNLEGYIYYEKHRVLPFEKISSFVNLKNNQTEQYIKWNQENIDLINSISSDELKEKLTYLQIIIKDGKNIFDRLLINYLGNKKDLNENEKDALETAKGLRSMLSYSIDTQDPNAVLQQTIHLGVSSYTDDQSKIFTTLRNTLKDKQKVFDFVMLHEFSHFLSYNFYKDYKKNSYIEQNMLFQEFVTQQKPKKNEEVHNELDEKIIKSQYVETLADIMSIQLLYKKYPELIKDEKFLYNIAKMRYEETDTGFDHLSYIGILYLKSYMKNNKLPTSLEDMLKLSKTASLVNAQYFSDIAFGFNEYEEPESRKKYINLNVKYNRNSIDKELYKIQDEVEKEEKKMKP